MRRLLLLFLIACNSDEFRDDGGTESGSDGTVSGGGDGGDASVDAPADVKKPRFCETVDAAFCSDFDIEGDAGAGWFLPPTETNGYTVSFETSQFKSGPTGLGVFIPGDAGGAGQLQAISFSADAGAMTMTTLDADIYVPNLPVPTTQPLFLFTFGAVAPNYAFALAHDGSAWRFELVPTKSGPVLSAPFAMNEWAHLTCQIVLSATAGYAALTITSSAGTSTAAFTPGQYPTVPNSPGPYPIQTFIGAQSPTPPVTAAQVYYDNVVVRYQ